MLLILALTGSGKAATLHFDPDRVHIEAAAGRATYADWPLVATGARTLVSARTFSLELPSGLTAADLTWSASSPLVLGAIDVADPLGDIATGGEERYGPAGLEPGPRPGQAAVFTGSVVETGRARYVPVTVAPIKLGDDGTVSLVPTISFFLDGRKLTAHELLTDVPADRTGELPGTALTETDLYTIVTSEALLAPARQLAAYKTATGIRAAVVSMDTVAVRYSGRDDAERLREYLKEFYADGGRYVLLAGDETVVPIRYAYHSSTSVGVDTTWLQICDLYFADLTGDWEVDGDGVWGERFDDAPDLTPELRVGRLPISTAEQFDNYIDKLIAYETNPGGGDRDYLDRAFFFSSDEMRDYSGGGQHARVAAAYPPSFVVDTVLGVEAASGEDPAPYNATAPELYGALSEGYGIVNIIAHGRPDAFAVRTTAYNAWPKSYFITGPVEDLHGTFDSLAQNDKVGFYYSLACDNGGFDEDSPPFVYTNPCLATSLLAQPGAGAVGFVAYSRWGWVGSSHLLQAAFFEALFAAPGRPAVEAMYEAKARYYYYRDLVYGQNFYGDPTLRVHTRVPGVPALDVRPSLSGLQVTATAGGTGLAACTLYLSGPSGRIASDVADNNGRAVFQYDFALGETYTIAAVTEGYTLALASYTPSMATDVDDDQTALPDRIRLSQNYPNPFNPTTEIAFTLPRKSEIHLAVYDVLGREVAVLLAGEYAAGEHTITWDADRAGTGVYFYRLRAEGTVLTRKMVLLK